MLLEVEGLVKKYRRGNREFFAVDHVDLQVDARDFVCVTGHSGSGKSTLLNILAGLLSPDAGFVSLEGNEYGKLDDETLSELRNKRIGYIPQGYSVLYNLSVLDNVLLPLNVGRRSATNAATGSGLLPGTPKEAALKLLARVGIEGLANESPRNLSGGELRRVSIARSLIHAPAILIADEPTADLDPVTTRKIMDMFEEIHTQGVAVILSTHEEAVSQSGTRRLVMENGILSLVS
jgi:putative ABC transport system ATP-binding protein